MHGYRLRGFGPCRADNKRGIDKYSERKLVEIETVIAIVVAVVVVVMAVMAVVAVVVVVVVAVVAAAAAARAVAVEVLHRRTADRQATPCAAEKPVAPNPAASCDFAEQHTHRSQERK